VEVGNDLRAAVPQREAAVVIMVYCVIVDCGNKGVTRPKATFVCLLSEVVREIQHYHSVREEK
jgi:hypothetical protein